MEKLNNISTILRDCPRGTKLYSAIHGECILDSVYNTGIHIKLHDNAKNSYSFNEFGQYGSFNSECLLFPSKENRDWSTFEIPFKEGDILYIDCNDSKDNYALNQYIFILKQISENRIDAYCYINGTNQSKFEICWLSGRTNIKYGPRYATKEEKEKLFKAIKDNGYQWNAETKTLEKLIVPKFKVGDIIQYKDDGYKVKITEVNVEDGCYEYESITVRGISSISFAKQDDWELVPDKFDITTLKSFESRVLVRSNNDEVWKPAIWGKYNDIRSFIYPYITTYGTTNQCIPYEGNEHLLGTTKECDNYYKNW